MKKQSPKSVRRGKAVRKLKRKAYRLESILAGMTPEAMREAFVWDADVGREIVEYHAAASRN